MTILKHQKFNNPTSHKDVLSKIRLFAQSCGWTAEYRTGCAWSSQTGGGYGWSTGNEDFLELRSTGYGTQDMRVRLLMTGTGTDPKHEDMLIGLSPGIAYSPTVATHPVHQDNINHYFRNRCSVPTGSVPALWMFGNNKYLLMLYQITQDVVLPFHLGTIDLFDPTRKLYTANSPYYHAHPYPKWYEIYTRPGHWNGTWARWDWAYAMAWWENAVRDTNWVCTNVHVAHGKELDKRGGYFDRMRYALAGNRWTGKRPLIKPTIYGKLEVGGLWEPVGTAPWYFLEFSGLNIGETLIYGTEEYLCFPVIFFTDRFGVAMRVK